MGKLDELVAKMNKGAKEEVVRIGISEYGYTRIPFTSPRMNYCTWGGIPVGKLIEFYGEEHGGKTTSALDIIANYQRMPEARKVLYADCENTLDVEWATKLGVNVADMIVLKPTSQSAEEIFQFILDAVDTGELGLFVIDSLGAMVSQQELEKTMEEKTYCGISKPLTAFARKAEGLMQRNRCTGIGINQIRDDLNSTWGGYTTIGGKGWKHFCAVRLEFRRGKFVDDKGKELTRSAESPSGNIVMMSMTKNKTCPPTRRTGFYTLNYATGVDWMKDLCDVAIKYGIIEASGAWYTIVNPDDGEIIESKLHGMNSVVEYLNANEEVLDIINEYIDRINVSGE